MSKQAAAQIVAERFDAWYRLYEHIEQGEMLAPELLSQAWRELLQALADWRDAPTENEAHG